MANEQNLVPLSTSKAQEIGRKGGINSGKAKRKRKLIKEQFEMLMSLELKENNLKEHLKALGIEENDITLQTAICVAITQQALNGNVKAFEVIRDTLGQIPTKVDFEEKEMIVFINDISNLPLEEQTENNNC